MGRIILASQSPRRKELLALAGFEFEVIPSTCEEIITSGIPEEVVRELSLQKAKDVRGRLPADEELMVIGADTIVVQDGKILGKPKDERDAFAMLKSLEGRTHEVYTGVTIIKSAECIRTFSEETRVTFYHMTDEDIWNYISTGDPMDKAGAYGIQSGAAVFIKGIEGEYNNVVGLPIARLCHELRSM